MLTSNTIYEFMNMTTKFAAPSAGAVVVSEKESRLSYDRAMISCIKEDGGTHTFFKSRPPVRGFTLFFKDPQVRFSTTEK